jgi:hypothetical protein
MATDVAVTPMPREPHAVAPPLLIGHLADRHVPPHVRGAVEVLLRGQTGETIKKLALAHFW